MMTLFGVSISPFVRKVIACLELKNLSYQMVDIIPLMTPDDYGEISPLRKIPAFRDGDLTLCDSTVICEYLEESYPDVATMPTGLADKSRARWLEEFGDTQVSLALVIYVERILKPTILKQPCDNMRVEKIIQKRLPPVLDYLETQIPVHDYLFGEQLFVADIAIATHFLNAEMADYRFDGNQYPKLSAYLQRIKRHETIRRMRAKELPLWESLSQSLS